ncbi:unnamed protein product [Cylicocyclus nassatus]|uniref:Uncharacterized protein n=1 Tax=Cylicocyclus nassatus TaxID=53992 RepID=A0AA36HE72_CYLNA|nr:unnamed protein product [Cylicocyclus nassatus]
MKFLHLFALLVLVIATAAVPLTDGQTGKTDKNSRVKRFPPPPRRVPRPWPTRSTPPPMRIPTPTSRPRALIPQNPWG